MKSNLTKKKNQFNKTLMTLSCSTLAFSMVLISVNSSAGAWVGKKGSGYIKLGFADYSSDRLLGRDDPTFIDFQGQNTSLYAEYGLGNNFSVYGSLLYQDYDQDDEITGITSANGFGDTEIGIRYQWQAEPFVLSTSFLVKTPFLYDAEDGLGNDQEDYEARILIGKGLNEYGYFGVEFGYRVRTSEPSDEYRYLLEYGFNLNKNIYFRTKLDGVLGVGNADESAEDNVGNLQNPLEFDAGKLELTTGWNFSRNSTLEGYGLEFTYTREIYGDNILQGDSYQIGITRVF